MRVLSVLSVLFALTVFPLDAFAGERGEPGRLGARHAVVLDHHAGGSATGGDDECDDGVTEYFESDPLTAPNTVVAGDALDRLTWNDDTPTFPGDRPGSLRARYDASLPAGLLGFSLPCGFDETTTFTAAAAFIVDSEGFSADPNGFFQLSWGLWNSATTGLNRTGSVEGDADSFELIEFDYYANVSPFFGGPFLTASAFGVESPGGAFSNFTARFDLQVELPLDVPLVAVLEHRPGLNGLVVQVLRVADEGGLLPLTGGVAVVPLDLLTVREYELDTVGLTLWTDGFGDETPALLADVDFHAVVAQPGLAGRIEDLLDPGHDDEDDDANEN